MYQMVEPITPKKDDKFQKLLKCLQDDPVKGGKCLIFTQFADTAQYLYDNLNPGDKHKDIDSIYGTDKSKVRVVGRFAPKANPQFKFQKGEVEIRWLVATDVLAEGLNMQDCNIVLNYDLHWNPVRLIQRFGQRHKSLFDKYKAFIHSHLQKRAWHS
jgi:superfamily II DNA/RNA helicase